MMTDIPPASVAAMVEAFLVDVRIASKLICQEAQILNVDQATMSFERVDPQTPAAMSNQ